LDLPDGTIAEEIVDFVAFGDKNPREILSGYEPSIFIFDEADLIDIEVLIWALSRAGRYPDKATHGEPWWKGIFGVCNAFDVYHPLFKIMQSPPVGWKFFRQPGGLSLNAENIVNLPTGYYQGMISNFNALGRPDLVRRLVMNEHGIDRADGQPVFDGVFSSDRHVSKTSLIYDPDREIIVGGDAGLHPAVVFLQDTDRGQWRVLAELYREGEPAPEFARTFNRFAHQRFGAGARFRPFGDAASANRTESASLSWLQIMSNETGVLWRPAPGCNRLDVRLGAVRRVLLRDVGFGEPGMVIDPKCELVVTGFAGGYHYRQVNSDGFHTLAPEPNKSNKFSHPMDALQNGILGGGEYYDLLIRQNERQSARNIVVAGTEFNPYD